MGNKSEAKVLNGMIDQLNKTTAQASAAIDEALAFVDASNKRIEAMERLPKQQPIPDTPVNMLDRR